MKFSASEVNDVLARPHEFGFCTFEEYSRKHYSKREQMIGRHDDEVAAIDRGDPMLGCLQRYYVENYRADSLEQCERIAHEMGMNLHRDFLVKPQLRHDPSTRLGFYNEVRFVPKTTIQRRKSW